MVSTKYCFVSVIENLKIDGPIGSNWNVDPDLNISNSPTTAKRIDNQTLYDRAGGIEANEIASGKPYLFAISDYPLMDDSEDTQMKLLRKRLQIAVIFCNSLWLIKDDSVNVDRAFLQYPFLNLGQESRYLLPAG